MGPCNWWKELQLFKTLGVIGEERIINSLRTRPTRWILRYNCQIDWYYYPMLTSYVKYPILNPCPGWHWCCCLSFFFFTEVQVLHQTNFPVEKVAAISFLLFNAKPSEPCLLDLISKPQKKPPYTRLDHIVFKFLFIVLTAAFVFIDLSLMSNIAF